MARATSIVVAIIVLIVLSRVGNDRGESSGSIASTTATPVANSAEDRQRELERLMGILDGDGATLRAKINVAKKVAAGYAGTQEAERAKEMLPQIEEQLREEEFGKQWRYFADEDPMTGRRTTAAFVVSTNTHNFSSPYSGAQHARLQLRRHPRHGNDVIFSIEQGQLLCRSYGDCPVRIRFDDEAPRTLTGNPPADHSSETIFLPNYADLSRRISKAKRLRIETNVYHQGAPMWEFNVEGFDPDKLK